MKKIIDFIIGVVIGMKICLILVIMIIPFTLALIKEGLVFGWNCGEEAFDNWINP